MPLSCLSNASLFITSCAVLTLLGGSEDPGQYPTCTCLIPFSQSVSFPDYWHKTSSQCSLHICVAKNENEAKHSSAEWTASLHSVLNRMSQWVWSESKADQSIVNV